MRLAELEPTFLVIEEPERRYRQTDTIVGADGVQFLCPKCFETNGGDVGTHGVICWAPHVPQTESPKPGRWELVGSSYEDLTLRAGSSSVAIQGGCNAHFLVQSGEIVFV